MDTTVLVLEMGQLKSLTLSDGESTPTCSRCGNAMVIHQAVYSMALDKNIGEHYRCANEECVKEDRAAMDELIDAAKKAEKDKLSAASKLELAEAPDSVLHKMGVPKKYHFVSFDNFVGGEKYIDSLLRYAEDFSGSIYLYGGCGSGKTHLAVSLLREFYIRRKWASQPSLFKTVPELLLDIRDSFNENSRGCSERDIIEKYCYVDFLVLDDFCAEKTTAFSLATLYIIINNRLNNLRPTLITSNITITEVESVYDERIGSRLAEYKYFNIKLPDYRKIKAKADHVNSGDK